ncbi:hypothetical protein A6A04_09015 [Paramagnetospirillum marisnigri]|uniref:Uncharacterized protein n=1 Tax=Paramagnetospirillum marisnigri TaxID=1285242 RepID=A0A178M5I8_9PROT|nr:hypothetical protein [Paramagnetospirillum marisnigri]OAN44012.1 hypothetical protein A6A04_09015 [Paramagnetospirillum marisnigri]
MARIEIYREEGPEKSGLIHFTAFVPNRSEFWRLKVHATGEEVLLSLCEVTNQDPDKLIGGMWLTLEDARILARGILEIVPGREHNTSRLMLGNARRV